MKKLSVLMGLLLACSLVLLPVALAGKPARLEEHHEFENRFGPFIGYVVANPGRQSWIRSEDRVYQKGNSGPQTERIGTIEDGMRLPCVGLMMITGWYRVVVNDRIAYVSYQNTTLDTSARGGPRVSNPLDIMFVQASSERRRSRSPDSAGNYHYYSPQNMLDGNLTTSWTPGSGDHSKDDGIGAYAEFHFKGPVSLEGIQLLNGYQRSKESFYDNCRAKTVEISFRQQGSSQFGDALTFVLSDGLVRWQHLDFEAQEEVVSFKLKVLDVYRGTRYATDIGITEVRASGF